jgi:hypothetical protein
VIELADRAYQAVKREISERLTAAGLQPVQGSGQLRDTERASVADASEGLPGVA